MHSRLVFIALISLVFIGCEGNISIIHDQIDLSLAPTSIGTIAVKEAGVKEVILQLESSTGNAYLTIASKSDILLDFQPVPDAGILEVSTLIRFDGAGSHELIATRMGGDLTIKSLIIKDYIGPELPVLADQSAALDFKTEYTWKYGGPSIGDVDNDGDYDLILNNHDKVPATLYWNDEGKKLVKHHTPLRRWDVHGSALGDYDNDGDLDIIIAQGGGNGTNPQPAHLFRNDNGEFIRVSDSVGITIGARGRSARWIDMDQDDDLDLLLINAAGILDDNEAKNNAFRNNGDGTFTLTPSAGIDMAEGERLHLTDFNGDGIDDIVLYFPLSVWQGNGDFTFSDVSSTWLPEEIQGIDLVTGAAVTDIDNDGDFDIYLSRGKPYYETAYRNIDFDSIQGRLDLREEGNKGRLGLEFYAPKEITFRNFFYWYRLYDDGFPFFLGEAKEQVDVVNDELVLTSKMAQGFPADISENGWYLGYLGDDRWRLEWNKNANIYWGIRVSIYGITRVFSDFEPQNRNVQDVLLRNDGDKFTDISNQSGIPVGGNAQGVIASDFNNDGLNDFYVFRFGKLTERVTDWMVINQGGKFITTQQHGARDLEDPGHGDMGQAFDLDLDGSIDLLSGSDNPGRWYLYSNSAPRPGNYLLVHLGYSPKDGVDPLSATITITTSLGSQTIRVGSAGAVHSQSLLNIAHFGMAEHKMIDSLKVRWRNGEELLLNDIQVNQLIQLGEF